MERHLIVAPASPAILEALRLTKDDIDQRRVVADPEAKLFASLLIDRLDREQREGDPFALDLWLNELASHEPLADYVTIINALWITVMRHATTSTLPELARLLERRDRLIRTVEAASPTPKSYAETRFEGARALQTLLANYAPAHVHNVEEIGRIGVAIAGKLGIAFDQTRLIWGASMVHDIGMVMIPRRILESKEMLSNEDFEAMKRHVEFSVDILRSVGSLRNLIPLVAAHHEWYNGSGYPRGLAGEEIPLGARVLSVADSVQAMLSPRPYRPARGAWEIREILMADNGTQWDPQAAQAAAGLIDSGEIYNPVPSLVLDPL